jgi:predicted nucleotidyltransferase component of viral defense system
VLRSDAQELWNLLENNKSLAGFVLVGGTALSMHLDHRVSEDLDLMWPSSPRLPRGQLEALKHQLASTGVLLVANDSPAALAEFEDTGMEYHDYQQDYLAHLPKARGIVKLTFVAPDPEVNVLLRAGAPKKPRVASVEEIFRLKCIACANRTKSRDWLDMYLMLQQGLFQPLDVYKTFELAGVPAKLDIAQRRMTEGKLSASDEGYEALLKNRPSIAEMQAYFRQVFDQIQAEATRERVQRGGRPKAK